MIREYNYNPLTILKAMGVPRYPTTPHLGVELELEVVRTHVTQREAISNQVEERLGKDFVICKRDGSLRTGFEVVTTPALLPIQRERWATAFESVDGGKSWLESVGLRAETSCGLHIHATRRVLSNDQIGRLLEFISAPSNVEWVGKIAGRYSPNYAAIKRKLASNWTTLPAYKYEAVNISRPNTIEFRLFASTTEWWQFIGRLEWVAAVLRWSRLHPTVGSVADFEKWVSVRAKTYSGLVEYLNRMDSLTVTGERPDMGMNEDEDDDDDY